MSGYRNPHDEHPDRYNLWKRPGPIVEPGRSPATMVVSLRGNILGAGTIRRLWRQTADYIAPQSPFSWTANAPGPGRPAFTGGGFQISRALRYMARSVYIAAGSDSTRYSALHTQITQRVNSKPVTLGAGNVRGMPTVRNRLTSFGSRVTPLNSRVSAAQGDEG